LEDRKVHVSPKLTKWSRDGTLSTIAKNLSFLPPFFYRPAVAELIQLPPLFDAVSWLGGDRAASICPVDRVDGQSLCRARTALAG
jgi:hypothetical protein